MSATTNPLEERQKGSAFAHASRRRYAAPQHEGMRANDDARPFPPCGGRCHCEAMTDEGSARTRHCEER
jgi:hypothetical protein